MLNAPPTLVIAIDGLRAAALGAYGQTAYETPAFDALAAESLTHGWCYAASPEPRDLYHRLDAVLPPGTVVMTDDPLATSPLTSAKTLELAVSSESPVDLAESVAETATAGALASVAECLVELLAENDPPPLLWVHLRGLYGPWDAPAALHEPLIGEDDPPVEADPVAPDTVLSAVDSVEAGDAQFAAGCRYAGQVIALDACLTALLDVVDGLHEGREHRLVVAGLRGFPLGEHGKIGGVDPRLFSEQQHVPLLLRDGDLSNRFARRTQPHTLDAALLALLSGQSLSDRHALLRSEQARAAINPEWLLRLPRDDSTAPELYVKPDDRWEQNDIASLEEEPVSQMLSLLAGDTAVASD